MKVPQMGDSISEGTVDAYIKSKCAEADTVAEPGEYVEVDETIASIETDKVTVDIKASHSGVILKYYAEEGDQVEVDAEFCEIDPEAKGGAAAPAPPKAAEPKVRPNQPS